MGLPWKFVLWDMQIWECRFKCIHDNKSRTNLSLRWGRKVIQAVEKVNG